MAHEIDMETGKPGIAYVGAVPWHGLGFEIDPESTIEDWREKAGLAWEIKTSPVIYQAKGKLNAMTDRSVLMRDDTFGPLSIVSDKYKVVQPKEILEFYRDLTKAAGFKLNTAGSLRGGRKIWALAEIGEEAIIAKDDKITGYLLLATSFDGSLSTTAMFTSVRVVCANTLQFAVDEGDKGERPYVKVPHNMAFNAEAVKLELGLSRPSFALFQDRVVEMAKAKVADDEAMTWIQELVGEDHDKKVNAIFSAYKSAPGHQLKSANDTVWGLVNAVTYYLDHARDNRAVDIRLDRAWFGDGLKLKGLAWDAALRMVA